ncbi:Bax inhibitor-1/YccA family protein [Georgenia satyanarayanai]|uniref:Bax inhibitor-1/YccA family protein n=1 Tax=Georgenia satyanarayanai TaxID=860221 RepID=UPI0012640FC0|nr:Bax inhibitor-1/YccA family protein [Georgenia satyanarayanai]
MSNPVFENSPYFGERRQQRATTPNGYPSHPGYAPQAGTTYQQAPAVDQVQHLEQAYQQPSAGPAQTGRMTYDDVIIKTGGLLALVVAMGALNWFVLGGHPLATFGGLAVGLVLGLVNAFKREPSPALIVGYAAAEGLFLGGISMVFESLYPGIVLQAVLATGATFVATLLLFSSGAVRVTPKLTRFVLIALVGYALFSLVNLGIMLFGSGDAAFGLRTSVEIMGIPLGVIVGVFAVGLAAICLIMDFDAIKRGVEGGIPSRFAWSAAFGLLVTLVWLYLEFLRLLAILRGGD